MFLSYLWSAEAGPQKDQYDIAALNEKHIVEKILQAAGAIREKHSRLSSASGNMYVVCCGLIPMRTPFSDSAVTMFLRAAASIKKDVGVKSFDNVILRSSSPSKML